MPRALAVVALFFAAACDDGGSAPPPPRQSEVVGCDGQTYPAPEASPYVLPYPVGTAYRMNLGNCSESYHGPERNDRYAYDFDMAVGTPVTAARAGTVVHVVEAGEGRGGTNNLVVVDHGDGSFAQYMHLTLDGADVTVGDRVEPGDAIGRSGVTGLAGYPHLHFIVTRDAWPWPYDPVPVSFSNADPAAVVLEADETYRARPY